MREGTIVRTTKETDIRLGLLLDGQGQYTGKSGCGFLDHMLDILCRHALVDLTLSCAGDVQVDDHHTVEDIGICLGQALRQALGDKAGIARYGQCLLPMDETLVLAALDLSGRAYLAWDMQIPSGKVGTFDTELAREFFLALVREGLEAVVNEPGGTGGKARLPEELGVKVAGKTGTAQTRAMRGSKTLAQENSLAWFAGYAPAEQPEIVVVALVEGGGHGGSTSAPLVQQVMEAFFRKTRNLPKSEAPAEGVPLPARKGA